MSIVPSALLTGINQKVPQLHGIPLKQRQVLSPHAVDGFSCFPQHLYNINQYIPIHFQFLRSFEPKRPKIALQGTFEAVDGNLESQSMYPWDKKVICIAWKVTYLLYIFSIYVVVSSNQAK